MSLRLSLTIHPIHSTDTTTGTAPSQQAPLFTPTRILSGREAISSLYAYDVLVKTTATPQSVLQQLGKRISLEVQEHSTTLHRIHGVVMSIESTLSYTPTTAERTEGAGELSWYKWTIRPALAKACYSRNRLVYNADELAKQEIPGASGTATPAEKLLRLLVSRWDGGDLCLSAQAAAHLPTFIQLIQNDESDYNFLSRLLATWGLAYTWQMKEATSGATPQELLYIFDAVSNDREPFLLSPEDTSSETTSSTSQEDPTSAILEPLSSQASLWTAHYGIGQLSPGQIALQNYNATPQAAPKATQPSAPLYSLHDESWDQLATPLASERLTAIAPAAHSSNICRGKYQYRPGEAPFQALTPGRKITWKNGVRAQALSADTYLITSQTITATDQNWSVTLEVKPVEQSEHITNTYLASSITETVMGFVSEADSSSGYAMAAAAQSAQEIYNNPITRPHFESVSVYSNSDVLQQSADHQILNAGGEIVLTAAQGITLRVGKSSIRITESGIQIASATGKVLHPGAYPAYNTEADSQATHLLSNAGLPMSGSILVDSSGVSSRGPYVSSTATNQVKQSTVLGSGLTITDFSAKLYAPQTTVIGGATLQDTFMSGILNTVLALKDVPTTVCSGDSFYNAPLQDGWKTKDLNAMDFAGSSIRTVMQAVGWIGTLGLSSKLSSLVSVTGSMLKLDSSAMTQASPQLWRYHTHLAELDTPLAGFFAMSERASMSNIFKKIPAYSLLLGGATAAGGSMLGAFAGSKIQEMLEDTSHTDTFTKPDATARPDTTSFAVTDGLGSSIGAGVGLTLGTAGAGVAALLASKAGKTTEQIMNQLANRCYLSKRNLTLGMEDVEALKKSQTLLQEENDALDKKELALNNKETAVKSTGQAVSADSDTLTANTRTVSDTSETVNETSNTINQAEQTVSASERNAIDADANTLSTNSGTQLNI